MEKNSSTKNFTFVGIGRFVTIILQALFYLFFAALLDPESYGSLNVIIAFAGSFSIISRFGLNISMQVYQAKSNSEITKKINTLFVILTSTAALILIFIDSLAAILCIALSFYVMTQQNFLGLFQYKKFMINSILKSSLFFIIPILLYFVLEIPGILLGMAIVSIGASIPYIKGIKFSSLHKLKNFYKVLIQNYLVDLSQLSFMLDKLLVANLFGLFVVGIYQFNLQIFLGLSFLPGVLYLYLISEESKQEAHRKIRLLVILGSIGLAVIAIFLSPIVVETFFPKYTEGIFSLQLLLLSLVPQSIGVVFSAKLISKESTRVGFVSLINIASMLISLTILGEIYDLIGLSLAVLITTTINTIILYFLYLREKNL